MEKTNQKKQSKRRLKGKVVSDSSDKTVVVEVETYKTHSLYHKRYKVTRRYSIHDALNKFKIDDEIVFEESRPFSKKKRWKAIY